MVDSGFFFDFRRGRENQRAAGVKGGVKTTRLKPSLKN